MTTSEAYSGKCLNDILNQEFTELEIINVMLESIINTYKHNSNVEHGIKITYIDNKIHKLELSTIDLSNS